MPIFNTEYKTPGSYQFQWNLTQLSSTVWKYLTMVKMDEDVFVGTGSHTDHTAYIHGIRLNKKWELQLANTVQSPIRYSWNMVNVSPASCIFIRSEWDGWIYNYNIEDLTIGSSVTGLWYWYWNSWMFSRDGKMMTLACNTSGGWSYWYYTISWTTYNWRYNFPFGSGAGYIRHVAASDWTIYVTLPNGLDIYACKINSSNQFTSSKVATMPSWYGFTNSSNDKIVCTANSNTTFYVFDGTSTLKQWTLPAATSDIMWVATGNLILIRCNNGSSANLYVYEISNLSTPIYTNTINFNAYISTTEGLEWFVLSGQGSNFTYLLN